jgi:hypothetical protein
MRESMGGPALEFAIQSRKLPYERDDNGKGVVGRPHRRLRQRSQPETRCLGPHQLLRVFWNCLGFLRAEVQGAASVAGKQARLDALWKCLFAMASHPWPTGSRLVVQNDSFLGGRHTFGRVSEERPVGERRSREWRRQPTLLSVVSQ